MSVKDRVRAAEEQRKSKGVWSLVLYACYCQAQFSLCHCVPCADVSEDAPAASVTPKPPTTPVTGNRPSIAYIVAAACVMVVLPCWHQWCHPQLE
jgi:hypothetical protein